MSSHFNFRVVLTRIKTVKLFIEVLCLLTGNVILYVFQLNIILMPLVEEISVYRVADVWSEMQYAVMDINRRYDILYNFELLLL